MVRSAFGSIDFDVPPAARPDEWAGQPGTRGPHLWVERAGDRVSTLDLFERGWVLLAESERWRAVCVETSETLGVEVTCLQMGVDFQPSSAETLRKALGIGPGGASLIRPDGYIAWRVFDLPEDSVGALTEALGKVSSAAKR